MKCPPRLDPSRGIKIRVVAPAGSIVGRADAIAQGIDQLRQAGFDVEWRHDLYANSERSYLAASDDVRSKDFIDALEDPRVDIVWCARGGSGCGRILEDIDVKAKDLPPKWVIGFSDITSILNMLSVRHQWVTVHGPTISLISKHIKKAENIPKKLNNIIGLCEHRDKGPILLGGNITVLASTIGTVNFSTLPPHILLLEDVNEAPYRLDRALTQLRSHWCLATLQEIWLGDLSLGKSDTAQICQYIETDFKVPVRLGTPAGHGNQLAFLPIGGTASRNEWTI